MRRGLIDSLKFPVIEPDYRYDRIKKGEGGKKQGICRRETVEFKAQKKMRTATDGSASLIRPDVLAFVCLVCASVRCTPRCLISMLGADHRVTL